MVDSNLQRENIKPSEKAFAYRMKLEAMMQQGKRTDLTFPQAAVEYIINAGLLSNPDKLVSYISKDTLTNAKKMMKAKNSPVLKIEKSELIARIRNHSWYKNTIKIENNEIIVNSEKEVGQFVKLLNDDILKSELTDVEYDSPAKKTLDPVISE